MFDLIFANPLPFLLAVIIGIATGWWIWANREYETDAYEEREEVFSPSEDVDPVASEAEPDPASAAPLAGAGLAGAAAVFVDDGPQIAAAVGDSDDLTRISGIGPKLSELCQSLGVRRFDQIAAWNADDVAEVDQYLQIKGRIDRDEWVPQAQLLALGNVAEWEARYGANRPRIAAASGPPEDLTLINGIGPKLAALCNELGVQRFDQIAAWTEREVDEVDGYLGSFRGRIDRDQWVEQAKLLARGEMQQWKRRFGYKSRQD